MLVSVGWRISCRGQWGRESSCGGPRCRDYRVEGGGVGGCGEERVDVNNVTVGGVGRSERTDMTMELKDGSVRGR